MRRNLGGRQGVGLWGPTGRVLDVQRHLARGKTSWWNPNFGGNSATIIGMGTPLSQGTATARNIDVTQRFRRMHRLGFVSAAAAGSFASHYSGNLVHTIGNGAGDGGFTFTAVFGCADAATVAGARQFVGFSSSGAAPSNVEPATLTNCIGVGHGAADTSLMLYSGGSAAQTPINLNTLSGTSHFTPNTLSIDPFELILHAASDDQTVGWRVENLRTGTMVEGVLANATPGTTLPDNFTGLGQRFWRTNNATALAVGLDIMGYTIEREF